jgi:UDP-N-acetylglucosamine--N-acetylmuramyl-(pentapeptide) pyrophosphoryl-undecaprenol N-acetylglucosamine transferase
VNQRHNGPAIVLTGGGSGGHITPLTAVATELKKLYPDCYLIYIGQRGDNMADIVSQDASIDETYLVMAGKFRRFHNEGLKQLLDIPTLIKNVRDFFLVIIGFWQCRRLLRKINPNIIFVKGGFIGVPVGLAAASLHKRFITHDSDAIPGLANRIISRWASLHAVALPIDVYNYPSNKTVSTGIPLQSGFEPVTKELQLRYRDEIDVPASAKLLFVIGGGLGAQRVNQALAEALPHLMGELPDLYVVQSAGRANEADLKNYYKKNLEPEEQGRVRVFGYMSDVYRYAGAADAVITEFALQGKACIVIPNPYLTGGHQLKNADYLRSQQAVLVINETDLLEDPNRLAKQASSLLKDPVLRQQLAKNISAFAKPKATEELARLIMREAELAKS